MSLKPDIFYKYIDMGISVIPVSFSPKIDKPGYDKKPMISWKEYQSRRPTKDDVDQWFKQFKIINGIGMITGKISGIVVVDVDDITLLNEYDLQSGIVVKSAFSDGRHFYYKYDDSVRNTAMMDGEKLDFRGDGGYVVIPPSHFGNKHYEFEKFVEPSYLDKLPQWFKDKLQTIHKTPAPNSIIHTNNIWKDGLNALSGNFMVPVEHGGRNNATARNIGYLLNSVARESWNSIAYPAIVAWNNSLNEPLEEKELRSVWNSIVNKHLLEGDTKKPETEEEANNPLKLTEVYDEYLRFQELKKHAPSSGYSILDEIIGGIIPGNLITFTANTNVGKTTFAANIAINLCNQDKKVLYFALEPRTRIINTLASASSGKTYTEIDNDPQIVKDFIDKYNNLDYYDKRHFKDITQVIEQIKKLPRYDAIIIDHMGYFTNNNDSVVLAESIAINELANIAYGCETAIINIVHTNKTSYEKKEPLTLSNLKGSSSIAQDSTDIIVIDRDEESMEGIVKVLKTKHKNIGAFKVKFTEDSAIIKQDGDRLSVSDANKGTTTGDTVLCKIKILELLEKYEDGLSANHIKQLLKHYNHSDYIAELSISLLFLGGEIKFIKGKYIV